MYIIEKLESLYTAGGSSKLYFCTAKPYIAITPQDDGILFKAVETPVGYCVPILGSRFVVSKAIIKAYELAGRSFPTRFNKEKEELFVFADKVSPLLDINFDYSHTSASPYSGAKMKSLGKFPLENINLASIARRRFPRGYVLTLVADEKHSYIKLSAPEKSVPTYREIAEYLGNGLSQYLGTTIAIQYVPSDSFVLPKWWRHATGLEDTALLTVKDDGENIWIFPPAEKCDLDGAKIAPEVDKGKTVVVCDECKGTDKVLDAVQAVKELIALCNKLAEENEELKKKIELYTSK